MAPTLSGKKTVTTAGTAVQLATDQVINGPLMVKALSANGGLVYVGNVTADVDNSNGMPLNKDEVIIFYQVGNLNSIWVDSAVNGEGVSWLSLSC